MAEISRQPSTDSVTMAVDQPRHQEFTLEVDELRIARHRLGNVATVTDGYNLVIADRHGLGIRMLGLARENFAVKQAQPRSRLVPAKHHEGKNQTATQAHTCTRIFSPVENRSNPLRFAPLIWRRQNSTRKNSLVAADSSFAPLIPRRCGFPARLCSEGQGD